MSNKVKRTKIVRLERLGVRYARYSDEQQASIPEQQSLNNELADEADVHLVAGFEDAAVSRSISDRPGLAAMFAYLEAHPEIGFIVVNELERLTAGISQRAAIAEMCQRLNITILTEDMGEIDPNDDDKMQEADQRAVNANGEVLKVRRRVRRALKQKVANGTVQMRPAFGVRMKPLIGPDGTPLPPGMTLLDEKGRRVRSGEIEVDEVEIEHLRKMFDLADEGKTDNDIARYLTGRVPTKSGNTTWRGNSVAGILTNPLYKGEIVWGRQEVRRESNGKKYLALREDDDKNRIVKTSPLGPLVPVEQWERVNARRSARVGELRQKRRSMPPQTFDELVYCLHCGYRMYGRLENAGRTYANPRKHLVPPFRYFCDSKHKRQGFPAKPGFKEPCDVARSMNDVQIIQALREALDGEAKVTLRRRVLSMDVDQERARLQRTIIESAQALERATSLHLKNPKLMPEAKLLSLSDEHDGLTSLVNQQLGALTPTKTLLSGPDELRRRQELGRLADVLSDHLLPPAQKNVILREAGIERIYVNRPLVLIEVLDGQSGA